MAGEQKAAGGVFLGRCGAGNGGKQSELQGILGEDLFYEHVHLTFDGNYLLARSVVDQVCQALPHLAGVPKQGAIPSRQRCAELLAWTPWDDYQSAADMVKLTSEHLSPIS